MFFFLINWFNRIFIFICVTIGKRKLNGIFIERNTIIWFIRHFSDVNFSSDMLESISDKKGDFHSRKKNQNPFFQIHFSKMWKRFIKILMKLRSMVMLTNYTNCMLFKTYLLEIINNFLRKVACFLDFLNNLINIDCFRKDSFLNDKIKYFIHYINYKNELRNIFL